MIAFSEADRSTLVSIVKGAFPASEPDEASIESLALALWRTNPNDPRLNLWPYQAELDALSKRLGLQGVDSDSGGGRILSAPSPTADLHAARYYQVSAVHDREIPDMQPFTGHFWMARVTLQRSR